MIRNAITAGILSPFLIILCLPGARAENIVFPPNTPGVHDVTQAPYYADNTGQTDVTDILTRALDENRSSGNWAPRIVYLPNGTYLVSGEVSWKLPPYTVGPHMQGQSRAGTVIRLKDSTWVGATQIGYVVKTGGDVAQNFCRGLFNLTINTGRANNGAIGVKWYANNEAIMSDVDIISEDGNGAAGMQVGGVEQGPCLARRVYVRGFRFGILARPSLSTTTLSEISVEGQSVYGVYHTGDLPLYIDSLYSNNTVPAVYNGANTAQIVLINAHLTGGSSSQPAIVNEPGAMIFARNIKTEGYSKAIQATSAPNAAPGGADVVEYLTHNATSLFGSPGVSLNLPIKRPPEVEWEQDMAKWANVEDYMGGRTDAQAIQAAIDDAAKTTVLFPMGREYDLGGASVYVRGNIRMMIATGAGFSGSGSIVVPDSPGSPSVVKLMKLSGPQPGTSPGVIHESSRTVIVESHLLDHSGFGVELEGTGDLFVTDVVTPVRVTNPQAHMWAWHYNAEGSTDQLVVTAGTVWIFGWKDEGAGTSGNLSGGRTEILGFFNFHGNTSPQFIVDNAAVSIVAGRKGHYGEGSNIIVRETKDGVTRELLATDNPNGYPSSFDIPLYTSYDPTGLGSGPSPRALSPVPPIQAHLVPGRAVRVSLALERAGSVGIRLLDPAGRTVAQARGWAGEAGVYRDEIPLPTIAGGIYWVEVTALGTTRSGKLAVVGASGKAAAR